MSRIVVVGAGVVGLMCGYELRRRGFDVTIVDRAEPGAGCSWANMGWIVPSFARPLPAPGLVRTSLTWMLNRRSPLHIAPWADPTLVRWLWRFWRHCTEHDYRAGLEALAQLAAPTMDVLDGMRADGVEFEMHRSGVLFLFLDRRARDDVQRDLEIVTRTAGGGPQPLERGSLEAMEPRIAPDVAAGIFVAQERHVRPESLVRGLLQRLQALGVEVRGGIDVLGARIRGARRAALLPPGVPGPMHDRPAATIGRAEVAALITPAGDLMGDLFLLAAGAWSARLASALGVYLPVQGGKGYTMTIEQPAWQPAHALYLDEARVALSPFDGRLRIGGTMEFSGLNTALNRSRLDAIRAASRRYLRAWPAGGGETAWAGLRPLTPDGLPVLGRLPGYENVFVATGHGMLGITLAPATAAVTAGLMRGETPGIDLAPFRADRFARSRGGAGTRASSHDS